MSKKSSYRSKSVLRRYRGLDWLVMLAIFAGMIFLLVRVFNIEDDPQNANFIHHARAIDGDSLMMNGQTLRLEGIDAVEYRQSCTRGGKTYLCGKLARGHLKKLLQKSHNQIKCLLKGRDKYDRHLAVCFNKSAKKGDLSLNGQMVRDGWAIAFGNYGALERDAKLAKRGLWAGEFIEPQLWRKTKP